ncbi:integral membrane protein 2Ca [Pygocentrus nattereri]|uniref:Integral membrane protein 2 n=1 Tax=Pygocentrus nattereri TaxID=42514 RepID=A0AAR2JXV0_PYGNA|nr:integral membrane protein 2Ca [Pygocentrus nattereri]
MGKIRFQPPPKSLKEERDGDQIPRQVQSEPIWPGQSRSSLSGLCCLTTALIVFTCSLIYASVYIYRYYIIPQAPDQSRFQCHVLYENAVSTPQRGAEELEENVGIFLQENYEHISVPKFSNNDAANIIHDFNRGLTAYHDIALDKCYITELNSTIVMPPRNLWELLINVKLRTKDRGVYLPQTYVIQEEMVVTGLVSDTQQLGVFIHRLCDGKDTFHLKRRITRRRIFRREVQSCRSIRHFENTFVVETLICESI